MLVEKDKSISLNVDQKVSYARPSIDVLFESAARVYQNRLIGVILTGANEDGAKGIRVIKEMEGLTIAQSPETAESPVMPQAAINTQCIDMVLNLEEIAFILQSLCR
jgi:two-component system chemotaxis response regulator CheB